MYRILVVDEDEHLLWALEKNLFPERDDLDVITADSGEEGLEILKTGSIDLLVSDIKMPGKIDGFQLILRAKEIASDARVVIMTAFGAGRIESFADRVGITHYIEKPFNISELRDIILDLLDEREGFQGVLSDLELTDIIQMLCLAKRSTLLHLKHKDRRGKIVFEQGDVVHAEFGETVGKEAVYEMLDLKQGDIFMESDYDYDQQTIHMGWQDLLLEGVKLKDEKRLSEASEAAEDNGGSPFASFRPEARIGSTTSESALIDVGRDYGGGAYGAQASSVADEESEPSDTDNAPPSLFSDEELEEISRAGEEAASDPSMFDSEAQLANAESSPTDESAPGMGSAAEPSPADTTSEGMGAEPSHIEDLAPDRGHSREAQNSSDDWTKGSTKRNFAPSDDDDASDDDTTTSVDENWSEQLATVEREDLAEAISSEPVDDTEEEPSESEAGLDEDSSDPEGLEEDSSDPEGLEEDSSDPEGLEEDSSDPEGLEEDSSDPEGLEEDSSDPEDSDAELPDDWGSAGDDEPVQSLSESSSFATVSEPGSRRAPSLVAVLEDFVADCPGLRVTGVFEQASAEPLSFIEASGAGTHDSTAMSTGFGDLVDRAQRAVTALDESESLVELQIVLEDAYAVVRSLEGTPYFQLATVDRDSSLGVILVMMRQYGVKLSEALKQRTSQ